MGIISNSRTLKTLLRLVLVSSLITLFLSNESSAAFARNCSGLSKWNSDRSNCDFRNKNLSGADFTGFYVDGSDFSGANLTNAVFGQANNAKFMRANLTGATFSDVYGSDFTNAKLRGANFGYVSWGKFVNADMTDSSVDSECTNCDMREANLTRARVVSFDYSDLRGANLAYANFSYTEFRRTTISGSKLLWTNFSEAKFYSIQAKNLIGNKVKLPTSWKLVGGKLVRK
jgi:uncharacterized protein YjbI with pentapeptide repeats